MQTDRATASMAGAARPPRHRLKALVACFSQAMRRRIQIRARRIRHATRPFLRAEKTRRNSPDLERKVLSGPLRAQKSRHSRRFGAVSRSYRNIADSVAERREFELPVPGFRLSDVALKFHFSSCL